RVSCSFSLGRVGAAPPVGLLTLDASQVDLERRLAAVAGWIARYGHGQPDVAAEILQWARIHERFGTVFRGPERTVKGGSARPPPASIFTSPEWWLPEGRRKEGVSFPCDPRSSVPSSPSLRFSRPRLRWPGRSTMPR